MISIPFLYKSRDSVPENNRHLQQYLMHNIQSRHIIVWTIYENIMYISFIPHVSYQSLFIIKIKELHNCLMQIRLSSRVILINFQIWLDKALKKQKLLFFLNWMSKRKRRFYYFFPPREEFKRNFLIMDFVLPCFFIYTYI